MRGVLRPGLAICARPLGHAVLRGVVILTLAAWLALGCWAPAASAEEGMWLPSQLPGLAEELQAAGLELDAGKLGDLSSYPLGAVVSLGGCTASFVSDQGLVVTNHHCAYGSIQHNSTPANNILEHGFLAQTVADELPAAPGSRVLVTLAIEDVTARILAAVPAGARGQERFDAIEAAEKALVAECEQQEGVRCRVSSFHGGLSYQLITQLEIRDVRLVYAPARSVGKYGGEVDNWMWPRHTGDFSFLRAYVGPDGRPADPSPENVPYRPRHWLRVAPGGVADGDFVMVAGYPGRTSRYRLADEVAHTVDWYYPASIKVSRELLGHIERALERYPDARLTLAPMLSGIHNRTKNNEGMLVGFDRTDVVGAKREFESRLTAWINADPQLASRYGDVLGELRALVAEEQRDREQELYWGIANRWPMLGAASTLYRLAQERRKPDLEREPGFQERDLRRIRERMERIATSYDARVDRLVAFDRIKMYATLPAEQRVAVFDRYLGIAGGGGIDEGALNLKLDAMYAGTRLDDLATRLAWMDADVDAFAASDDPFIRLAVALYPVELEREAKEETLRGHFQEVRPRFMEALIAYQRSQGAAVYPDANATLRVTYGNVAGYHPQDAVWYEPFTKLEGLLEKETGVEPFDSPAALLDAIRAGDTGPYALASLGSVPVNLLSTLDTTGGNSGSPTLNRRGELVGLLFDGAWESLLSDYDYEPERVRSIHADVRYMLWVMDRVDGAHRLLREMGVEPRYAAR